MKTNAAIIANQSKHVAHSNCELPKRSYLVTMTRPDAEFYPDPSVAIRIAQAQLKGTGVKIDPSFQLEPVHIQAQDGGPSYYSYTMRADMTAAQAKAVEKAGFLVSRDKDMHILKGG